MPDLNERVTRLEERSDAHLRTMDHLHSDMSDLRHSMDGLRGEMAALRSDMVALAKELRGEMATLRSDMAALGTDLRGEMAALRADFDRRFTWVVGLQVVTLGAVVAALVGAYYR
ncbi:MAG: hypothetical protein HY657_19150 [Acidobacteria bacterium]|nr:hypothetical protein [Acidobacteriota bacterium]